MSCSRYFYFYFLYIWSKLGVQKRTKGVFSHEMNPMTRFCSLMRCSFPIIQAPMAGGPSTVEMARAALNAGSVASLAAAYLLPGAIHSEYHQLCALAEENKKKAAAKPPSCCINLFLPSVSSAIGRAYGCSEDDFIVAVDLVEELIRSSLSFIDETSEEGRLWRKKMVLDEVRNAEERTRILFERQFDMVLQLRPMCCSFAMGCPTSLLVHELHNVGILVMATATTLEESNALRSVGVDMIVLQGKSAGGHLSTHAAPQTMYQVLQQEAQLLDTDSLVKLVLLNHSNVVSSNPILFIAAGGISTKHDVQRMIGYGVAAVQVGSALLLARESGVSQWHRHALCQWSLQRGTILTVAFSGRLARGIPNSFTKLAVERLFQPPGNMSTPNEMRDYWPKKSGFLTFPQQNIVTRSLRNIAAGAATVDGAEFLSLWCGESMSKCAGLYADRTTEEILASLF